MPIKIQIVRLSNDFSKRCDFCEDVPETYKTLKLMTFGQSRFKICHTCLKNIHDMIHLMFQYLD